MPKEQIATQQQDTQWESHDNEPVLHTERPITKFTWGMMGATLALLFSPILLALLFSGFDQGTRVMMGIKPMAWAIDPIIYLAFYWAGIHFLLSSPLTQFGYPATQTFKFPILRCATLFALLAAPLCSYAYYRAGTLSSGQWVEIFMAVVPSAAVASLCFYRLERKWLFSAWAAIGTYVPVFLVNDLMGPFTTYFAYASPYDAFYYFRYVGPAVGIGFAAWLFLSKRELLGTAESVE